VRIWIWVRATYPRYRYDLLINLAWKAFLPQALGGLAFLRSLILI
jgi:NADH-quinone oxidoreductase subunit H